MAPENEPDGQNLEDRSDEQLTPKEAYHLTEEQGMMGKAVAKLYDVTPSYVSQLKSQYKEGIEQGRESVTPSDFEREELEQAIADEEPESNPYDHSCPLCDDLITPPDTAGVHPCPSCGEEIEWSEDEI